jgi:hypothetical protein
LVNPEQMKLARLRPTGARDDAADHPGKGNRTLLESAAMKYEYA